MEDIHLLSVGQLDARINVLKKVRKAKIERDRATAKLAKSTAKLNQLKIDIVAAKLVSSNFIASMKDA